MSGSSGSFSIDLAEVESSATMIQRMHDDLHEAFIVLNTYVGTVNKEIYGKDLVGTSLGGKTAAVIGLSEQQEKTLAGMKAFLENTAQVAANLKTMAASHRGTDSDSADDMKKIEQGNDIPLPLPPSSAPGGGYVSPQAPPKLDYNHAGDRPEPAPRPQPGGRNLL
ncbi:hypothetical protein ACIA8O_05665 [Kitasatospora sp. NPDC051853]|uniref:hypothetical protein n=1 Tax=Kitasatospora sp. NPDC051853 TaxID=3364058 RepID=UPI0037BA048C